jgi:hypothetical protein
LKFEALVSTVTLTGSIHGQRNNWTVSVNAPGGITETSTTVDDDWSRLFNAMLASAHDAVIRKRFPERHRQSEATR